MNQNDSSVVGAVPASRVVRQLGQDRNLLLDISVNDSLNGILEVKDNERPTRQKTLENDAETVRKGDDSDSQFEDGPGSWDNLANFMKRYQSLNKTKTPKKN